MKDIKTIKKTIAIFLTFVLSIPTLVSCSQDENTNSQLSNINKYKEIEKKYEGSAIKLVQNLNVLNNRQQGLAQRNSGDIEITQELIDDYASTLGYRSGEVSLELVNSVLDGYSRLHNEGFVSVIASIDINQYTRDVLINLNNTQVPARNLYTEEFNQLPADEQEILIYVNTMLQESYLLSPEEQAVFRGEFAGGIIGIVVGLVCCGGLGAVFGFLFGSWLGGQTKN